MLVTKYLEEECIITLRSYVVCGKWVVSFHVVTNYHMVTEG